MYEYSKFLYRAFVSRKKLQSLLLSNEIPTDIFYFYKPHFRNSSNVAITVSRASIILFFKNEWRNDNRSVKYFVRRVKISYIDSANFCRMVYIECYRIDLCRLAKENCFLINFLALHSSFQKSTMNYSLYRPYSQHNFFRRNDAFDICLGFSLASNQIV